MCGEVLLLSTETAREIFWIFRKERILVVGETHLYWIEKGSNALKRKEKLESVVALTKCLM
jgi:hypothetical protein